MGETTEQRDQEPHMFKYAVSKPNGLAHVRLCFVGHYNEPDVVIQHQINPACPSSVVYQLAYDPRKGEWEQPVIL